MKRSRNSGESKASPGMLSPAQVKELSNPKKAQAIFNPKIHFDDPRLLQHLRAGGRRGALIHEFLTLLAVCHTVIPEKNKATGEVTYRAASPDEEALVKAAKCLGYDFQTPAPVVQVDMSKSGGPGSQQAKYEIVNVNEFNSTRKRMSVVVKVDGKYILYCKGADSVMYERALGQQNDRLLDHLRTFASEGLRTLVLARRQLSRAEYTAWNQAYQRAANSTRDRSKMLERVAEKVEVNLQIIGATAIEDKLQQGVPRCIADLAHAGIKIWVLTGDKEETAINIGYASKLLTRLGSASSNANAAYGKRHRTLSLKVPACAPTSMAKSMAPPRLTQVGAGRVPGGGQRLLSLVDSETESTVGAGFESPDNYAAVEATKFAPVKGTRAAEVAAKGPGGAVSEILAASASADGRYYYYEYRTDGIYPLRFFGAAAIGPGQVGSARKLSRRDIVKVTCQVPEKDASEADYELLRAIARSFRAETATP